MIRDADDTYSYTFLPDGRVDTMIAVGDPTYVVHQEYVDTEQSTIDSRYYLGDVFSKALVFDAWN